MFKIVSTYLQYAGYAGLYIVLACLLNLGMDIRSKGRIAGGNLAAALRRGGAHVGLGIALLGVLLGNGVHGFWSDLLNCAGYGMLALLFMGSSLIVADKLVLYAVDNHTEIEKGNVAVAFVECGLLVMTGIIAMASIYGEAGGWLYSVIYYVVGQGAALALVHGYVRISGQNLLDRAIKGNVSAGIYLAGKIIAYGLILMPAIKGNGLPSNVMVGSVEFLVEALMGVVMLNFFEWLIDLLVVTESTVHEMLEKDNTAAVIQLTTAKLAMALILGLAIL
jgi:uncharacterized membrane protein YjfL (UPF0719 family)